MVMLPSGIYNINKEFCWLEGKVTSWLLTILEKD